MSNNLKKNSKNKVDKDQPAEEAQEPQVEVSKVDFDAWFAVRSPRIPKHHHKEIIKADFSARGIEQSESLEVFDEALRKYGIKLN